MSTVKLKYIIDLEYERCKSDPVYFMKKYVYIQHPIKGSMLFNLYPFQESVLKLFRDNPYSLVLKSRQLGISTLVCGYVVWFLLFNNDKNVLTIANKQEIAKNLVSKVQYSFNNLPGWLKKKCNIEIVENNKLNLRLSNGSKIKAVSASGDSGRSEAVSLLIIDEAAFIPRISEIVKSILPTLSEGGGCIALSTPNGIGNWFHEMWEDATHKRNAYLPIKLKWNVHPERNEDWRKKQDEILGDPRKAAQECDAEFLSSGETVFSNELINEMENKCIDAIEKRYQDGALHIFKRVDYSHEYLVTADVARGDGKDYSTAHVIDLNTSEQVASFKAQIGTSDFGNILVSIGTEYNNAIIAVDNSSIGWNTVQVIVDREYKNLYYSPKGTQTHDERFIEKYNNDRDKLTPGFTISHITRPAMLDKLSEMINTRKLKINCIRTINEFRTFIWKNGRQQASEGNNDDMTMALAIGAYLFDGAQQLKQISGDMNTNVLSNMKVRRNYSGNNPYGNDLFNVNGEDFRWVL